MFYIHQYIDIINIIYEIINVIVSQLGGKLNIVLNPI